MICLFAPAGHSRTFVARDKTVKGRVSGPQALPLTVAGAGDIFWDRQAGAGRPVLLKPTSSLAALSPRHID